MVSTPNIRRVFKGDFSKLWLGQLISNFGDNFFYMGLMAMILYTLNLEAAYLGLLMVMMAIPTLFFGPIAGSYVDRWNRKHVMVVSDILRGFIVLSLVFYHELWYIYASIFLLATVSRFFYPAQSAIIPDIVEEDVLMSANSLSQTTYMLSAILGPALGASLIGFLGVDSVFLFDGISFFISAVFIFSMRFDGIVEKKDNPQGVWKETWGGIKFAEKHPVIGKVILYVFVLMLFFGGFGPLYMIFIRDVLKMGLFQLGVLEGLQGVGSLVASIVIGIVGSAFSKKSMVVGANLTISSMVILLVLFPYPWIAFQVLSFFGVGMVFFNTPLTTILQEKSPDEIRGRVFGAFGAIMQVAALISMGVESVMADYIGVSMVMLSVGIMSLIFGILFFSSRKNREIFEQQPLSPENDDGT